jgi:origin recognition complex subunit 6
MNAIDGAIRAVAPELLGPIPQDLRQLTSRLYASSKQKIPLKPQEEIARYHLCAAVAVTRQVEALNVASPTLDAIPLPPKSARDLVSRFMTQLEGASTTPQANSPFKTPQAQRVRDIGTPGTLEPSCQPPLKSPSDSPSKSPSKSPFKRGKGRPAGSKNMSLFAKDLRKNQQSALTSALIDAADAEKNIQVLISRQITTICNKFQLSARVVQDVLDTYQKYCNKVANEWILISGLVLNCYIVIHHKLLKDQVGGKASVSKIMLYEQKGGLTLSDIQRSVDIVRALIDHHTWFKELKKEYVHDIDQDIMAYSGTMLVQRYMYHSKENREAQAEWVAGIHRELGVE